MRALSPFLYLLFLVVLSSRVVADPLPLRDNERILVLTDLSLADDSWPILLEQYLRVRYPEKHITFFTLDFERKGVEEATAYWQDGLLTLRPTLVLLQFGSENPTEGRVNWRRQQAFTLALQRLCQSIVRNNIPFAVLGGYGGGETSRFQLFWGVSRAENRSVAADQKGRWINFEPLMKKYSEENIPVTVDGHLTEAGHVAALISILQNLGWTVPAHLTVTLPEHKGPLTNLDVTLRPPASARMSFFVPPSILKWTLSEASIANDLHLILQVPDLIPGRYAVNIDETSGGVFTSEKLDSGVYLPPGVMPRSPLVREWVARKQKIFSMEWMRALDLGKSSPGCEHLMAGSLTAEEGFEDMIRQLAKGSDALHLNVTRLPEP